MGLQPIILKHRCRKKLPTCIVWYDLIKEGGTSDTGVFDKFLRNFIPEPAKDESA